MSTATTIKEHEDNIVKCELTELILTKEHKEAMALLEEEKKKLEIEFSRKLEAMRQRLSILRGDILTQRRKQRSNKMRKLQALEDASLPTLNDLKADPNLGEHAIDKEINTILSETENREVKKYLARFKIKDCSSIGISDSLKLTLANLGITTADQLDEGSLRKIDSLTPAQLSALLAWRNYLLAQAAARSPKQLTGLQRKRVVARWTKQKAEVQQKINALERRLAEEKQIILSHHYELKRSTILSALPEVQAIRYDVTQKVKYHKYNLDLLHTKQHRLRNDFELALQKIGALIEGERNIIQSQHPQGASSLSKFRQCYIFGTLGIRQFRTICLKLLANLT